MASSSPSKGNNNKAKELQSTKQQEDGKMESGKKRKSSMHAKMEWNWIKALRNQKYWGQEEQNWSMITEEEIAEIELTRIYDFDYVLKNHLLQDEQIVWAFYDHDDVWASSSSLNN